MCYKNFGQKNVPLEHIKVVHNKVKYFECSDCGETFGQKYNLLKHIKKFHKNIKNFKCEVNVIQFTQKSNLEENYKNEHNNVKKSECNICKKNLKRIITFGDTLKIPTKENYLRTQQTVCVLVFTST